MRSKGVGLSSALASVACTAIARAATGTEQPLTEDLGGSVGARPRERFLALDSLRGICAICVAMFHFQTIGLIHNSRLILHSWLFVDFFFVLSGFVITASYGDRLERDFPIRRFMLLRLGRIYPLHAFMLVMFLLLQIVGMRFAPSLASRELFHGASSLHEFFYGLFFVMIFIGTEELWYNGPSWSIAAEMWTYLLAAIMFKAAGRRVTIVAAFVALASFAAYVEMLRLGYSSHHWGSVPRCLFSFALGVCAYRAYDWIIARTAAWSFAFATVLEAGSVVIALMLVIDTYSLVGPFAFTALVLIFAFQRGWLSRVLVTGPMLLLGTLSYSIYMVNVFVEGRLMNVLTLVGRHLDRSDFVLSRRSGLTVGISPLAADLFTIILVLLVIATAWCTYHLIERPGQRWSRRLVLGSRGERTIPAEERAPTF